MENPYEIQLELQKTKEFWRTLTIGGGIVFGVLSIFTLVIYLVSKDSSFNAIVIIFSVLALGGLVVLGIGGFQCFKLIPRKKKKEEVVEITTIEEPKEVVKEFEPDEVLMEGQSVEKITEQVTKEEDDIIQLGKENEQDEQDDGVELKEVKEDTGEELGSEEVKQIEETFGVEKDNDNTKDKGIEEG